MLVLAALALSGLASLGPVRAGEEPGDQSDQNRGTYHEAGDETQNYSTAREMASSDVYYGNLNRVSDRSDYFSVEAVMHDVVNAHVYILGHDGKAEWVPPDDKPPSPGRPSAMLSCYIYCGPRNDLAIDGAYNYPYIRHYCLNICAPVPGTNTYYVNVSLDWYMTPNNYTWDYMLTVDISSVPTVESGKPVSGEIDLDTRDTHWYKVFADEEMEISGALEISNFCETDPSERNINIWAFPADLGGYPRAIALDWSAAPKERVELISVLTTYSGWYFIKLRGMNHHNNFNCSYNLNVTVLDVPKLSPWGINGKPLDRHLDDTDWYKFELSADVEKENETGLWNEAVRFVLTERATEERLPDFDLYLFARLPGTTELLLLNSSISGDHISLYDPRRDPDKNTETVEAAAIYNGTYFVEVNAYRNSGTYDLRREDLPLCQSDGDNIPSKAREIKPGVYQSHIHQAFDHFDWYRIPAEGYLHVQFDTFKYDGIFNVTIFKWDPVPDIYVPIIGGWNTDYNHSTGSDIISNLIDIRFNPYRYGLGAGYFYVAVTAIADTYMYYNQSTGRTTIFKTDGEAEAQYELRIWSDWRYPEPPPPKPIPDLVVDEDTDMVDYIYLYDHFIDTDVGGEGFKFRASLVRGKLKQLILRDDKLGFLAEDDFTGNVMVKVSAIDEKFLQTSLTWCITFRPVNDPPRPSEGLGCPHRINMTEDQPLVLDLSGLFYEVDVGTPSTSPSMTPCTSTAECTTGTRPPRYGRTGTGLGRRGRS